MATSPARTVKVGVFVAAAFVLATISIFLIGDNRRQWDRKITYHAKFNNVVGLRPGAAVRIGGIDVGYVSRVGHADDAKDPTIYVAFDVAKNEATRVKSDTTARIVGRGLLGDKMIELTGGTPSASQAKEDSFIASEGDPSDLGKAMTDIQDAARNAKESLADVKRASERLADPQFNDDLHGSVAALREILDGVAHKDGVAHRLVFDPEEAKKVDRILANLDQATANLDAATADARAVTERVKDGPGLAHTMLYDEQTAGDVAGALAELHGALTGVREKDGLAHLFIYGDDANTSQHVMQNLAKTSDDLRDIVANLKAGRGTIGALLVDPSVYEDVKALVGNVERNQVLRALVRYSIKQNEERHEEKAAAAPPR